ncbi:MAG: hypothetical protein JRF30_13320 [Deltaproteobacteria bacterium]|nr:hypothetical protein [Deltaproteobacteria bacterium]
MVETNIAYAVDARPLWDSIRLLTRIMETCRISVPASKVSFQPLATRTLFEQMIITNRANP